MSTEKYKKFKKIEKNIFLEKFKKGVDIFGWLMYYMDCELQRC